LYTFVSFLTKYTVSFTHRPVDTEISILHTDKFHHQLRIGQ